MDDVMTLDRAATLLDQAQGSVMAARHLLRAVHDVHTAPAFVLVELASRMRADAKLAGFFMSERVAEAFAAAIMQLGDAD